MQFSCRLVPEADEDLSLGSAPTGLEQTVTNVLPRLSYGLRWRHLK